MNTNAEAVARIGPNAVTQLLGPMQERLGPVRTQGLLHEAGFESAPDASHMLDERPVARLHGLLRQRLPESDACWLSRQAGRATADYLLAHRIPRPAASLLRWLPDQWAMRLLVRAIGAHAWTFAGSGRFYVTGTRPWTLAISNNPLAQAQQAVEPVCLWHSAVFERLFQDLLGPDWTVNEVACCAKGDKACLFRASVDPDQHARFLQAQTLRP